MTKDQANNNAHSSQQIAMNPYESPTHAENKLADPLALPAVGCLIGAVVAAAWSVFLSFVGIQFLSAGRELSQPEYTREGRDILLAVAWCLVLSVLAVVAAYNMRIRRRRWLVMFAAILGVTPLGGMFSIPLAAIVLIRLWRSEVWNSFN